MVLDVKLVFVRSVDKRINPAEVFAWRCLSISGVLFHALPQLDRGMPVV